MKSGDEIDGTWRLLVQAPGPRSARRWRAADATGQPAEVLSPRTAGAARPAAVRRDWAAAQRAVQAASDPALIVVHSVVETSEEVRVVRAPLEDATLADIDGPLAPEEVAWVGARLFPAVLAVGQALGGALLPSDVGIDSNGHAVLAPMGPNSSHVERAVAGAAAPETFDGATPDGRTALYGLGAVLYRLAAGRAPTGKDPAPPSTWNHRITPELDRAITALLSSNPDRRPTALPILQQIAGEAVDLRTRVKESRSAPATRTAPSRVTEGVPVVLAASELTTLDPHDRSVAAGIAGVPLKALDALIEAHLPLVLERSANRSAANNRAAEFEEQYGLAAQGPGAAVSGALLWALVGIGGGALLAGIGAALAVLVTAALAIPGIVLGTLVAGLGLWRASQGSGQRNADRDANQAWQLQERGRKEREQWPAVARLDARVARIREDLHHADLPPAADADVRDALKEVEHRLDAMIGVLSTAERALGGVDRTRLRTKLAALDRTADPERREERDKVARMAADLDAVQERRDRQLSEIDRMEEVLDDLAASLAHRDPEHADSEVAQVARTAQLLRRRESEH